VLNLPLEALKAENESNRFLAAAMLVSRYRLSWLKDRKLPEKAIDAEESRLPLFHPQGGRLRHVLPPGSTTAKLPMRQGFPSLVGPWLRRRRRAIR
jgi:hypothetical protein